MKYELQDEGVPRKFPLGFVCLSDYIHNTSLVY